MSPAVAGSSPAWGNVFSEHIFDAFWVLAGHGLAVGPISGPLVQLCPFLRLFLGHSLPGWPFLSPNHSGLMMHQTFVCATIGKRVKGSLGVDHGWTKGGLEKGREHGL